MISYILFICHYLPFFLDWSFLRYLKQEQLEKISETILQAFSSISDNGTNLCLYDKKG